MIIDNDDDDNDNDNDDDDDDNNDDDNDYDEEEVGCHCQNGYHWLIAKYMKTKVKLEFATFSSKNNIYCK